jgi:hypothetical protein
VPELRQSALDIDPEVANPFHWQVIACGHTRPRTHDTAQIPSHAPDLPLKNRSLTQKDLTNFTLPPSCKDGHASPTHPPLSLVRLRTGGPHLKNSEHKATRHYGINTSRCRKKNMMIGIGKLVVVSILDDEGFTLEINRMARREEKAGNEVSMWESYAPRLQETK